MLPEGWSRQPLHEVAEVRTGLAKGKTGLLDPVELPYLRVANVQDGFIDLSEVKMIAVERHQIDRYSLKQGDILMTEGGDFDKLGRGAVWDGTLDPCLHQNHVFAVRAKPDSVNPLFLSALSGSEYGRTYFLSCAKRSTNLASINSSQLKAFPVLLPPIAEQNRIAHILSTWDQAIATTDRLLKNSQKQMDILLRDLTLGTHRTTSTPSSWENFTLGELGRTYSGLSGKKGEDFGSGAKFIPYTNVFKNNRIDIEDFSLVKISEGENQTRVKSGDIIFTISSETPNEVGMASVLLDDVDELYLNSFCFGYRLNEFTTLLPEYAAFALRAPHIRALMTQLAQGSTRYNISKANVMRMKLTLPSITEQKRITPILNEAHSTVKNFRDQLARLKQEKAILMSQLLTGKRRVRLPADETASA
ncbi:restriction endonuclease subunit S [Xanthomonas cerealis pv. cerealis]|uniref:Restriction endonuclease subunit S n=1 Tax=Xanthomonas cerealis pv. cerealis TaxID=152263 RepID=A0A514EHZ0_9XANT|nr:restriction endonuclease subunit S [Xanthomonas translucens]QDI05614.1 restriction endonuclease subunit S [Xanthomonas translucens pv. cerealis]